MPTSRARTQQTQESARSVSCFAAELVAKSPFPTVNACHQTTRRPKRDLQPYGPQASRVSIRDFLDKVLMTLKCPATA